jgi:hypothetical protein
VVVYDPVRIMPIYLIFVAGSQKHFQLALRSQNLLAKLANCDMGPGTEEIFLSYVSYCQN